MGRDDAVVISRAPPDPLSDEELEALLHGVYVGEGFTPPEAAATAFSAPSVRARGELLTARQSAGGPLLGLVIVVPPGAPSRRLAGPGEAEMHLLAVHPEHRGLGVGSRLVEAALTLAAQGCGAAALVLWTQPTMHSAQRLYASCGFTRAPARDAFIAELSGRHFLVFERALSGS